MEVITSLETNLARQTGYNEELKNKLLTSGLNGNNMNEQNCIEFFSKLLDDKD